MGAALSTGGLGGMPPGGGGGAMPEDQLLQQIRDLLDQYLAMGQDTPVAPQAQALADAIDGAAGGGAPPGYGGDQGPPPGGPAPPGGPGLGDMGPPPDMGQGPEAGPSMEPGPGEPPRDTSHKTFASANKSARARLEQRNKPKRPKPNRNK